MRGYFNDPEKTAESLRGGWLWTGDLATRDEDGFFYYVDRKKDIVRRRGENVSSVEVEVVLTAHPAVEEAAVVGVPSELTEEEVLALVQLLPGARAEPAELASWCRERLADFKVPRYIQLVPELPKTSTGRLQKGTLRDELADPAAWWDAEARLMRVVVLPGDCIGPEIMAESYRVLARLAPDVELEEKPFGAAAIRATGTPLPEDTLAAAVAATAVLKGAGRGPGVRRCGRPPRTGVAGAPKALDVYANLRPARGRGIDLLVVRELVGGLYFGEKGVREDGTVFDTCEYHPDQVERIARRAFELARTRRRAVVSVDKANVLETSRLWRRVVDRLAPEYEDVSVEHMLVDNAAMQLVRAPEQFDVILTENTFGDILSDVAAEATGGARPAPSASLGGRPGGCTSRRTARRPTSRARASRTRPRCCARPPCCSSTGSAAGRRRRASTRPSTRRSSRRRRRTSAGRRRPRSSATRSWRGS